ncbi:MAG: DUF7714 family protein [Acidimicrobiia bacterium]
MTLPENFICRPYRGVSVQHWDIPLGREAVTAVLGSREAYRRTEFVVLRSGGDTALVRVECASDEALFNPIRTVEWLGGPVECAYVVRPEVDTANATALAEVALAGGGGRPVCVVEGRYQHVNFIYRARPVDVAVVDVVPPSPSRLFDLAAKAVEIDEDLPPVRLVPQFVEISDLVGADPDARLLMPCQGAGVDVEGHVDYLDQRPALDDWTLVGCERSHQFHRWFYGRDPDRQVDFCPDRLTQATEGPVLLRCCLLERGYKVDGGRALVPWGTNLSEVQGALRELMSQS